MGITDFLDQAETGVVTSHIEEYSAIRINKNG
jgi:hypothetical protein